MKFYHIEIDHISLTGEQVKSLSVNFTKQGPILLKRKCNHSNNNHDNDNKDVYIDNYDTTIEYYHILFLSKSFFLPVVVNIGGLMFRVQCRELSLSSGAFSHSCAFYLWICGSRLL